MKLSRRNVITGGLTTCGLLMMPTLTWAASSSEMLIAAARRQLGGDVRYDGTYRKISYPGGDVPPNIGVCTDVIIRAYRAGLNCDLQKLVHEDMRSAFAHYPKLWGLMQPDPSIDHRRVPNLETFFTRQKGALPVPRGGVPGDTIVQDLRPGDLLTWRLGVAWLPHIGIVTEVARASQDVRILHNIGAGPQEAPIAEMALYVLVGHYRYAV